MRRDPKAQPQTQAEPAGPAAHTLLQRPTFNLNLLRSLDVLLETRNLTASAAVLGLTQSALSRQLTQLRHQMGDPLLVREGQRYVLTQRAEGLRGPLKALLASTESVLASPGFEPASCTRQFSLAGSDYLAEFMLPDLARTLAVLAPRLSLAYQMWEPGTYRLLSDEGVDVVATIADTVPDNLHGRSQGEDRPVCVMRADHPLAQGPLNIDGYLAWPHARIAGGGDKNSFVEQHLANQGMRREIRLTVPFASTALRTVAESDLLLTLPVHMAIAMARHLPLVYQALPFEVRPYRYWLLWHARNHHDAAHQWFREQVFVQLQSSPYGISQFSAASA
jgi:DNA-binding transcriptional LysR family regulator